MRPLSTAVLGVAVAFAGCSDERERALPLPTTVTTATTAPPMCQATTLDPQLVRPGLDQIVTVFLLCGNDIHLYPGDVDLYPVQRLAPADRDPLDATLQYLFLGVTPSEAQAGFADTFSSFLGASYIGATVDNGVAVVQLRESFDWTNNLSTATASAFFYLQFEANVFQFAEINGLEYVVGGERWCGFENPCMDDMPYPYFTRPTTASAGARTVEIVHLCGDVAAVRPSDRACVSVRPADGPPVLRIALSHLFSGPTSEEVAAGQRSHFSEDTWNLLREVVLSDGTATIDMRGDVFRLMNGVGTTNGSSEFLVQVLDTAFQFETVEAVILSLDGDAADFCRYIEAVDDCNPWRRADWETH